MIITITPSSKGRTVLAALQRAVDKTLDKKEKLGQYAVIWQNGKVVLKGADVPAAGASALDKSSGDASQVAKSDVGTSGVDTPPSFNP